MAPRNVAFRGGGKTSTLAQLLHALVDYYVFGDEYYVFGQKVTHHLTKHNPAP